MTSLIPLLGDGVQPSNTGRVAMFSSDAPIWRFFVDLGSVEKPEAARTASTGLLLAEVLSAIALASLDPSFLLRRLHRRL